MLNQLVPAVEDRLEPVVLEEAGAYVGRGLDDGVAEDDGLVADIEGRGSAGVPVRGADVDVLAGGRRPQDVHPAPGQGLDQAGDVLVELVNELRGDRPAPLPSRMGATFSK
jgi:hypothetical protein